MLYEYLCGLCNREFEVSQKISEEPLEECIICKSEGKNSPKPKKLISLSSFQLLGGGWSDNGYS